MDRAVVAQTLEPSAFGPKESRQTLGRLISNLKTNREGIPGSSYTNQEPETSGFNKRLYLSEHNGEGRRYDSADTKPLLYKLNKLSSTPRSQGGRRGPAP